MDENTTLDMKELNGKNYQEKFKNRGKIGSTLYPKPHLGNSMSMANLDPHHAQIVLQELQTKKQTLEMQIILLSILQ